jgi:serine/threonine protein kinase
VAEEPDAPSARARAEGTRGTLTPGSKVAGYVIEEQIGAGGMAIVYRARDDVLGRLVAVKVLAPALASDEEFRARFLRESRAVAAVDEPHIVPVYGAGDADGLLYIATRFVAGGDLSRLQRAAAGPLPSAQAADLVSQVAGALDAAHAIGLVHRDVKPGNILVEKIPGRPEYAYLSDFGLSKSTSADATGMTAAGRFLGTPDFCAPEQIAGGSVDGRADQYALACVAFSLLAGTVPFSHGDVLSRLFAHVNTPVPALTAVRPELPAAVDGVLARGLAKNPAERYESCAAFALALRGALGLGTGASQPASLSPQSGAPQSRAPQSGAPQSRAPQARAPQSLPPQAPEDLEHQHTVTSAGWRHPSLPPDSAGQPGPGAPSGPPGTFPPGGGGAATPQTGHAWLPGSGQVINAPGGGQHPSRRRAGLIVGGSAAAAVLLAAGVIVGVTLSGQHGKTGGSPGPTVSAGNTTPSAAAADRTGTASLVGSLAAPGNAPMSYAFFSADGNDIAVAGTKADVYVFSAETLTRIQTIAVGGNDTVDPVAFSPDDKTLYAIDPVANAAYDLDIATGTVAHRYALPSDSSLGYTFGTGVVGSIGVDDTVSEFQMASGKLYAQVKNPGPGTASIAAVRPDRDGGYILISDTNGVAYLVSALSDKVVGTFRYPYSDTSNLVPQLSLDGNTVDVPGGPTAAAKLWDRTTGTYITPTDPHWPTPDGGVAFSVDSKFAFTSPASVSEVNDIWNIATHAHVLTLTVPGGANEEVESIGPGASELLSTGSLNISAGTFTKLNIWSIPG